MFPNAGAQPSTRAKPVAPRAWEEATAHPHQRAGSPTWATPGATRLSAPAMGHKSWATARFELGFAGPKRSAPRLRHFPQSSAPTFPAEAGVGAEQPVGRQAPAGSRKVAAPWLTAAAAIHRGAIGPRARQPPLQPPRPRTVTCYDQLSASLRVAHSSSPSVGPRGWIQPETSGWSEVCPPRR